MSVSIKGLDEAVEFTDAVASRMRDMSPLTRVLAEDVKRLIDDSFAQSRSPGGEQWAALKPSTVRQRRQGSDQPLIDTGTLRNSAFARGTSQGVSFGAGASYGPFHQFGTRRVPARPFLPVTQSGEFMRSGPAATEVAAIRRAIVEYLKTGRIT